MSHTLVTLPFSSSPRGHEVKNLQKMHMNFIHQPILIVCAYDRSIPQYDRIPKRAFQIEDLRSEAANH